MSSDEFESAESDEDVSSVLSPSHVKATRSRDYTAATVSSSADATELREHRNELGIYGWRKKCLYILIVCLLIIVIINLSLTLWVLKVMELSPSGMGNLRVSQNGVQLSGQAVILDSLIASGIRSRKGQPLHLDSSYNFTVMTRDDAGKATSRMLLSKEKLEYVTRSFQVKDTRGKILFSANRDEVVVGADTLRVSGTGGAVFDGTVQTTVVRAGSGHELKLESPTRSLEVKAPSRISFDSPAGDIRASCLYDLKLKSHSGSIKLASQNIYFPNLRTASPPSRRSHADFSPPPFRGTKNEVYQLCTCGDGRLFLAPPLGVCATDENSFICR